MAASRSLSAKVDPDARQHNLCQDTIHNCKWFGLLRNMVSKGGGGFTMELSRPKYLFTWNAHVITIHMFHLHGPTANGASF